MRKPGRPEGSKVTDNEKMGIVVSRKNYNYLQAQKQQGKSISWIIGKALDSWKQAPTVPGGADAGQDSQTKHA